MIVMMTSSILPILSFVIIMDDKSNIWRNDEADLASVLFEFEDAISFYFFQAYFKGGPYWNSNLLFTYSSQKVGRNSERNFLVEPRNLTEIDVRWGQEN